jgi:tRNA(fMet)-specific endonuclease VapC
VRECFDVERARGAAFALSAVVLHELRYGAAASERSLDNARKIDLWLASAGIQVRAFDADDAAEAGRIRALLRRVGTPVGPYDAMIAAQALRARATLVTANGRDLERVPGLHLIDWSSTHD